MEYYSAFIKEVILLPFATTEMEPDGIMLKGIIQIEKDKYYMV